MRVFQLLLALGPLLCSIPSQGSEVVVVQGNPTTFGRIYFCGFSSSASAKISAFYYHPAEQNSLLNQIKKKAPDLIFTLGEVPLPSLVEAFPSTPFVVSGYHVASLPKRTNVIALDSDLPLGAGLKFVQTLFPTKKTVGTVYNPKLSKDSFDQLVKITGDLGFKLSSLKADSSEDIKAFINAFAGKTDLLYWIRDSTTADPAAVDEFYRFALQNNVPVISTDASHMEKGALLSVAVDPFRQGQEAWKLASRALNEKKIPRAPTTLSPSQLTVSISHGASTRLGIGAELFYAFTTQSIKEGYTVRVEP